MMNERIKELKHQASLWCDKNIPEQYSEETNGYGRAWEDKFAELIVRDCMDIAANIGEHGPVAAQEMQELFGVSE
jgi:hypothetical protein